MTEEKVLPSAVQPVFVDVHTSNNVVSNEASAEPFVADNSLQQLNEQASESTTLREVETSVELMIEAVPDTQTKVEVNPSLYKNNDALIIAEEAEENHVAKEDMEEQLSDMQVQHLTIENSTIHIGQLNVEQAQQNEFVQVKTDESQPVSTGSRLPFNVLMLKSDKEKLLAKEIFQEQLRKKRAVRESEPMNLMQQMKVLQRLKRHRKYLFRFFKLKRQERIVPLRFQHKQRKTLKMSIL